MHQQGGSQSHYNSNYRPPEISPEAAAPIRSRPSPLIPAISVYEDFSSGGQLAANFPDEEGLVAGEDAERGGGGSGNRWPRQETLVLLKIRSDMDAAFRDATLKGPLWEDVSRKLAELGYSRNAKKCKEKFENVHKYYKRTKEGRAGRQDGKSYRFFSQLEALNSGGATIISGDTIAGALVPIITPNALFKTSSSSLSMPVNAMQQVRALPASLPVEPVADPAVEIASMADNVRISFSSNSSSSSSSDSDGEETEEAAGNCGRKRKPEDRPTGGRKMMAFFDGLMKQVMDRQEAMQKRFIEAFEKREQDRMIRDEAWKRQEMARLNREYELMVHERAISANRDNAVISFLQSFPAGLPPNQPSPNTPLASAPKPSRDPPLQSTPAKISPERNEAVQSQPSSSSTQAIDTVSPSSSSRWPKPEVIALIKMRSGLETRYLEEGPKGPLWEEISLGMKQLGYSRNAKRCKEKWENINKYFKKVKESNKRRTEDAKTCPYFSELDTLYRRKLLTAAIINTNARIQTPTQNNGYADTAAPSHLIYGDGALNRGNGAVMKMPEEIVAMGEENKRRLQENDYENADSDTVNHEYEDDGDNNYDEDEEDEEEDKLRYEIQFQRQGMTAGNPATGTVVATTSSGSFLAMVQ